MTTEALSETAPINDRDDAERFIDRLSGLLISLTKHLERESADLKSGKWGRLTSDPETKSDLMHAYRSSLQTLKDNRAALSRFVPVKLDELRRLNATFQGELQRNLATVSTAKAVSEQLLSRLADQVSGQNQPKTYSASGVMTKKGASKALSVDRSL